MFPNVKYFISSLIPYKLLVIQCFQKTEPDGYSSDNQDKQTMEQTQRIWCGNFESQDIKTRIASDDYAASLSNETETPAQFSPNCISGSREDSFDYFGRYLASTLRDMPKRSALQLQGEIMTLLIKSQMEINSRPSSNLSMLSESTN